jgi:hypothetical protein
LLALLATESLGWGVTDDFLVPYVLDHHKTSLMKLINQSFYEGVGQYRRLGKRLRKRIEDEVGFKVKERVEENVGDLVWRSVQDHVPDPRLHFWACQLSAKGYGEAHHFAFCRFYDTYLAPNDFHAIACFNELVSGYWLGKEAVVIVRRPRRLCLDGAGRLHGATGKCIEYQDGWGLYAWHGMRVPEQVILAPERLSRDDFLNEPNVEVRRVIQERMGQRFVSELGGVVIDSGPRGTLYEVGLPGDPEGFARYLLVQDASTDRQYFLRVPPTIWRAAEAVAWSFGLSAKDYHPADET